jgi:hypothetical protein
VSQGHVIIGFLVYQQQQSLIGQREQIRKQMRMSEQIREQRHQCMTCCAVGLAVVLFEVLLFGIIIFFMLWLFKYTPKAA